MDDNSQRPAPVDFRRLFLWTHLFRSFRIALDIRKALLAAVALVAVAQGNAFISRLPFAAEEPQVDNIFDRSKPVEKAKPVTPQPLETGPLQQVEQNAGWLPEHAEPFAEPPLRNPLGALETIGRNGRLVFEPLTIFAKPALELLDARTTFAQGTAAWTRLLWTMLVWGLLGGAITRLAAVEFATDERHKLRPALRFAFRKILSYFAAPLLPMGGLVLLWVLGVLAGLLGRIPGVGEYLLGAGMVLPLVFGLVMALILLVVSVGWPLMSPTISAEGSDAFDGLSRSFSYVFGRPWHYLLYALVALAYGYVIVCFVLLVGTLLVHLTAFALAGGMGVERVASLMNSAPHLLGGPETLTRLSDVATGAIEVGTDSLGLQIAGLWLHFLALLIVGFVYSYFWSAATIVYFLLRRVDDATALDEVYLDASDDEDEMLPLVGVAASDQPVIERRPNVDHLKEPATKLNDTENANEQGN